MSNRMTLGILVLVGLLCGCYMDQAASPGAVPGDAATALAASGGGPSGVGHLGTAFGLFFPDDRRADNSWFGEVNFNVNIRHNFALEASATYASTDVASTVPAYTGTMEMIPIVITGQYGGAFGDGRQRWYAGLGLGYCINEFSAVGVSAKDSFYVHFGGGVDIPIQKWLRLNVELRYMISESELSGAVTDLVDLDAFMLRANLVYLF